MKQLHISPPLLNTPCPWCKDLDQLRALYQSPFTGAVTTRTSMLDGFPDDPAVNQFIFFNPTTHQSAEANIATSSADQTASLNTIGFSPYTLAEYLGFIQTISNEQPAVDGLKPFIVSVTGTPEEMREAYRQISQFRPNVKMELAMEINLSCPNIPGKISPAYDTDELLSYFDALKIEIAALKAEGIYQGIPIGVKAPPFTYQEQFDNVITALKRSYAQDNALPIRFISSTNTVGSSLLFNAETQQAVLKSMAGTGIGGMAGAAIHPLALGNVYTLRTLLDQHAELHDIQLIGVGGVSDAEGYKRMKAVGAYAVGIATALGTKGIAVFEEIHQAV